MEIVDIKDSNVFVLDLTTGRTMRLDADEFDGPVSVGSNVEYGKGKYYCI